MEIQGQGDSSLLAHEDLRSTLLLKPKGHFKQSGFGLSAMEEPSDRIFKWWTIITLATDVAILLFACLPIRTLFWNFRGGVVIDMLILASILARGWGIGLFIFASNSFLLGRMLYQRYGKAKPLEEKTAVPVVRLEMGINLWTVLMILVDIVAIVFPLLTLYIRRPEVSYAEMHGEVYPPFQPATGLTTDKLLYVCVFLWVIIFASNTILLIRNLFHKCEKNKNFIG